MRHHLITSLVLVLALVLGACSTAVEEDSYRRAEMPDHGYAISFPDEWEVVTVDAAELRARALKDLDDAPPAFADGVSDARVTPSIEASGRAAACGVQLQPPTNRSAEDLVADSTEGAGTAFDNAISDGPHGSVQRLGVGDVARFDFDLTIGGEVVSISQYLIEDGERMWLLNCSGEERPADSWLSIAETFEFLPTE